MTRRKKLTEVRSSQAKELGCFFLPVFFYNSTQLLHRSLSFFFSLSLTDLEASFGDEGNCFFSRNALAAAAVAAVVTVGLIGSPL